MTTTPLNVSSTRSPEPTATMTPFSTFALLYMTAIFLELGEDCEVYPYFTLGTLLLAVLFVSTGITHITFLIFLGVTTSHFLLVQFPDVHHVNMAIYCNLVMILGIVYSLVRIRDYPADDDCFELMRPVLQGSLILVYALAGFHKLNASFFDPAVSCVDKLLGDLNGMARSASPRYSHRASLSPRQSCWASASLLEPAPAPSPGSRWGGSPRLRRPGGGLRPEADARYPAGGDRPADSGDGGGGDRVGASRRAAARDSQAPGAGVGLFVDDARDLAGRLRGLRVSCSCAALHLVPRPYRDTLSDSLRLPIVRRPLTRLHVYFAINVAVGVISGLGSQRAAGLLFNLAALVFIWPLLSAAVAARPTPAWTGVPLSSRMTPKWMLVLPRAIGAARHHLLRRASHGR